MISGGIIMWSGGMGNIPSGYVLCDGNNGTPDLRDKFVVGSGTTYNPDDTGGAATHDHDFTTDGHDHLLLGFGSIPTDGSDWIGQTEVDTDTGTTDAGSTLPPYYSLAYIMKT